MDKKKEKGGCVEGGNVLRHYQDLLLVLRNMQLWKKILIVIILLATGYFIGWWSNEMNRFAGGVVADSNNPKYSLLSGDLNSPILKYIFIKRSGRIDTVYRKINQWSENDSTFLLEFETIWGDSEAYTAEFLFPKQKNIKYDELGHELIGSKIFKYNGVDYEVLKYLQDDPNGSDEELLCFYSSQFGLLIERSAWWGNYDRIVDQNDGKLKPEVFYLIEMIINDHHFFTDWQNEN